MKMVSIIFFASSLLTSIRTNEYYEEYYYNQDLSYYYEEINDTDTKIDQISTEPNIKIEEKYEPTSEPEYIEKSSHLNILDDLFLPVLFNYCSYGCDKPNSNI